MFKEWKWEIYMYIYIRLCKSRFKKAKYMILFIVYFALLNRQDGRMTIIINFGWCQKSSINSDVQGVSYTFLELVFFPIMFLF